MIGRVAAVQHGQPWNVKTSVARLSRSRSRTADDYLSMTAQADVIDQEGMLKFVSESYVRAISRKARNEITAGLNGDFQI